ncbi:MAG TPA: glycosyltransferase family 39 protein [Bacteroidota bacterium]|nr:glycosyltransferase family 39 protein [Bacteroidota bacterium]
MNAVKQHAGIAFLCLLFAAIAVLRLNEFSYLTPDSATYLILGNSVAHGHGWLDTTTPLPDRFVSRGPGLPILLAPVEMIFPMSLIAAKIWMIALGIGAILLLYFWIRRSHGKTAALAASAILALNPMYFLYSTEVLSEIPFIATIILAFVLANRIEEQPENLWLVPLFALTLAAGALFRDIGAIFVVAAAIYFLTSKRYTAAAQIVLINAAILGLWFFRNRYLIAKTPYSEDGYLPWMFSHVGTPPDVSFVRELWWRFSLNAKLYLVKIGGMMLFPLLDSNQFLTVLPYGFTEPEGYAKYLLLLASAPLLALGIYADFKHRRTVYLRLLFAAAYLGALLLFPMNDIRYHFPLFPIAVFYLASGAGWLAVRFAAKPAWLLRVGGFLALCVFVLPNIRGDLQLLQFNIGYQQDPNQPWNAVGEWLKKNSPESSIIGCPSKDLAEFIGNRKVMLINPVIEFPQADTLLRDNAFDYMIAPPLWGNFVRSGPQTFGSARFWFEPVLKAGALHLLKIHSAYRKPVAVPRDSFDLTVDGMMLRGRSALLDDRLKLANRIFIAALNTEPDRGDLVYETVSSYAMMGDTTNAWRYYQRLISLPSGAGVFVYPAMRQLDVMETLARARSSHFLPTQAVHTLQVAILYWRIGYYRHATALLDTLLTMPDTYMFGLLWGLHFNLQMGDTTNAQRFLKKLIATDSSNTVVKSFRTLFAISDTLCASNDPSERCRLRLKIAAIYRDIELPGVSIDEAERAIHEQPSNVDPYLFIATILDGQQKIVAAKRAYEEVLNIDPNNRLATEKLSQLKRLM